MVLTIIEQVDQKFALTLNLASASVSEAAFFQDQGHQPSIELIARLCHQPLAELSLEHEDSHSRRLRHREHLEDEGRGNLVGCVGDEDVEGRPFDLDRISQQDLELPLLRLPLYSLRYFGGHSGIELDGDDFPRRLQDANSQVTGTGTDFEDRVGRFQFGFLEGSSQFRLIRLVRECVPTATMASDTPGFFKICWPKSFWKLVSNMQTSPKAGSGGFYIELEDIVRLLGWFGVWRCASCAVALAAGGLAHDVENVGQG